MKNTTIIEQYINTPSFKSHVAKVINKYDKEKRYIDDVIQDFCLYYIPRPDKQPNIRKLYNQMFTKLKKEKRYILFDINDLTNNIENIFEDNLIQ